MRCGRSLGVQINANFPPIPPISKCPPIFYPNFSGTLNAAPQHSSWKFGRFLKFVLRFLTSTSTAQSITNCKELRSPNKTESDSVGFALSALDPRSRSRLISLSVISRPFRALSNPLSLRIYICLRLSAPRVGCLSAKSLREFTQEVSPYSSRLLR